MAYRYYVEEKPLKGPVVQLHKLPKTELPMNRVAAEALAAERHAQFPRCRHTVYNGTTNERIGEHMEAELKPGEPGTTNTPSNAQHASKQRPSKYSIKVVGIPPQVRSSWLLSGRLPAYCRVETGLNGEHEFSNWDTAYYVCTDLVKALKALGWKSKGNYKVAVWNLTLARTGKDTQHARIFFGTHFEKITQVRPDPIVEELDTLTLPTALPVPDHDDEWDLLDAQSKITIETTPEEPDYAPTAIDLGDMEALIV